MPDATPKIPQESLQSREKSKNEADEVTSQLRETSDLLSDLRNTIDNEKSVMLSNILRREGLTEKNITYINKTLRSFEKLSQTDTAEANIALDTMIQSFNQPESAKKRTAMPEGMDKVGEMIDKMTKMFEGLTEQMGGLGSGTLKKLEEFFGANTMLGKLFTTMKNYSKAQVVYLEKKLLEQQKTLSLDTNAEKVTQALQSQIVEGRNIEQRAKRIQTYDIVQHTEELMAKLDTGEKEVSEKDVINAGVKALEKYAKTVSAGAPVTSEVAGATQETERAKTAVSSEVSIKIKKTGDEVLKAKFEKGKATIKIDNTSALLSSIDGKKIEKLEVMGATDKADAAVLFTLDGNVQVQVEAGEFKKNGNTQTKNVRARNITSNSDLPFEITFA